MLKINLIAEKKHQENMPPAPAFQCYSFKIWKIYICFLGQQNLHKGNLHREIEGKKEMSANNQEGG